MRNQSYSSYRGQQSHGGSSRKSSQGRHKQSREARTDTRSGNRDMLSSHQGSVTTGAEETRKRKPSGNQKKRRKEELRARKLQKKQERKETRKERVGQVKQSIFGIFKRFFVALMLLVLVLEMLLMISQNASIDALRFEINDLNASYEKQSNVLKELNSQKETAFKSETIENIARYNLGMVYPSKEQTIYIDLD